MSIAGSERGYRRGRFRFGFGDRGPIVDGITDGENGDRSPDVCVSREVLESLASSIEVEFLAHIAVEASVLISEDGARIVSAVEDPDYALTVVVFDGETFFCLPAADGWIWTEVQEEDA